MVVSLHGYTAAMWKVQTDIHTLVVVCLLEVVPEVESHEVLVHIHFQVLNSQYYKVCTIHVFQLLVASFHVCNPAPFGMLHVYILGTQEFHDL